MRGSNFIDIRQIFLGAVMGTSVSTHIFVNFGWRPAAAFNLGLFGWQLFVLLIRGPHCERYTWLGWQGGLEPRKEVAERKKRQMQEGLCMEKCREIRRDEDKEVCHSNEATIGKQQSEGVP